MTRKGVVSSVDVSKRTARIVFQEMENIVSFEIPYAQHVSVKVNDEVAVSFFSESMADGIIYAVF